MIFLVGYRPGKLEIVLSASVFCRGGWKGAVFALLPAELVNKIGSDFFSNTHRHFTILIFNFY
jgi:hypothetical protein